MPHKTRFEKFERYFERYHIRNRLTIEKAQETETHCGAVHSVKTQVERFASTPDCIDFFNPDNKDLWLPGVTDSAEYLHRLNQSALIKALREHTLDCRKCQVSLDAFFLSQVNPKLFRGMTADILKLYTHYDPKKHLFITGLPWPKHETSTQTGRLVYVTPLPRKYGKSEFDNTILPILDPTGMLPEHIGFNLQKKHDGSRKPCYQATTHLPDESGYICIRSRTISNGEEETK